MEIKAIEYGSMTTSDNPRARASNSIRGFTGGWTDGESVGQYHFTPIYNLLNSLTECDDIDHGNRYFDDNYFGTQFKAFRNLGAEWQAWVHVKISQAEVTSGVEQP